jgi:hypothetical protein
VGIIARAQENASKLVPAMQTVPAIEKIIGTMLYQGAAGAAHLAVATGLSESDPVVLNAAQTFFAMTIDSHLQSSLMCAARLHDNQNKAATIRTLLNRAAKEADNAKHGTRAEIEAAIAKAELLLAELNDPLKRLDALRNRRLAHTDPRTISDPTFAAIETRAAEQDLKEIYRATGEILNRLGGLYANTYAELKIIGHDDYKTVLEFIKEAKCRKYKEYEQEFGKPNFPAPKDCP